VIVRVLATVAIVGLLALDLALPRLEMLRQGPDLVARADVEAAVPRVGEPMPDFTLPDLDGVPVTLSDLRGHRVLITFERSVDW
jgi:cytochrome oxidase Cu insertion factor (SCO1/SenC/PrrC family)